MLSSVVDGAQKTVTVLEDYGEDVEEELLGLYILARGPGLLLEHELEHVEIRLLSQRLEESTLFQVPFQGIDEGHGEGGQAHEVNP